MLHAEHCPYRNDELIHFLSGYIPYMTNYEYTCVNCGGEAIAKKAASRSVCDPWISLCVC